MPVRNIIPSQKVTKEKLQRAKELRREMTPAEKLLWQEVRAKKLGVRFRRQQVMLIDRSTGYIRDLASVSYEDACRTLFEVIEYVEPRRCAGKAYPAPVGVAAMRLRHGLSLPEAEARLVQELA